ncbi:MAG: sensor histidine kinase [Chloroflexi bacterium]|nr:sensor histidine kinase [Chloroflexota bacterium]OQB03008.1 MAG: Signal transduction histidine-protein kinase/phosphatase DegS [Chloroflexi bacterium ADurb.Bin222]HOC20852.1 histidine kinase [Anaerolineae bacterium]HQM13822.1 histidine kinase [Anaerolineae bacterium]
MVANPWEQFLETCHRGYDKVQQELKEVDMLIQQTSTEVDRLVQHNARAAARVRQVEAQFETVPREDIKTAYSTMLENQQRLFTMRGQLEKLQSDQKNLTRLVELYKHVLEQTEPATETPGAPADVPKSPQAIVTSIIEAQERERQRLSRQMHDGPAQSLTNLVLQAEICERYFDRSPERARAELAELKKNVVSTFQKVKGFIFDLRPMMLDDLGLMPTLKRYVEELKDSGYPGVTLTLTGKERRLVSYKEVAIFRLIQELVNIGREHGRATSIKITMDLGESQARIGIEDNGSGFELDEALTSPNAVRLGLLPLRERVEMLGGEITFSSSIGQGMRTTCTLPIEPA